MQISERLKTVSSFVTEGMKVADIGTDHAYVPIYLIQNRKIPSALAMDVKEGPLKRASAHIVQQGLSKQIETRLSNGFSAFRKGEAQSVVIAGLGGELMIQILRSGKEVISEVSEFILSPHSEIHKVRAFLMEQGFSIVKETMLCEEGIYYTIIKAVYGIGDYRTEPELWYGKRMLEEQHPVLYDYLQKEYRTYQQIIEKFSDRQTELVKERKKQMEEECVRIEEALTYYDKKGIEIRKEWKKDGADVPCFH